MDKSDAAIFGTRPGLRKLGLLSTMLVADCPVTVEKVKILGVILDSTLSFDDHFNEVMQRAIIDSGHCNIFVAL